MKSEPTVARLSGKDKALIRVLQEDLPICPEPYHEIARRLGMNPDEVISKVRVWTESGVIRRFGASVRHRSMGYKSNCMVVWNAPEGRVAEAGHLFAGFPEVTHCYRRPTFPGWPYCLYTMIHGTDREGIEALARRMSEAAGLDDYKMVYSVREWKKTSMKYFSEKEPE